MKKTISIMTLIFVMLTVLSCTAFGASKALVPADLDEEAAKEMRVMPLIASEACLPTVVAHEWLHYSDKPGSLLEGAAFDREGNFYFVAVYEGKVFKLAPNSKTPKVIYDDHGKSMFGSLDIHKDGRLFLCDLAGGKLVTMNPDGSNKKDVLTGLNTPDDICFDAQGNIYMTCLVSDYKTKDNKHEGRVYKISADLKNIEVFLDGYAGANGIAISPDGRHIYTTEYCSNTLIRTDLLENGKKETFYGAFPIYRFTGINGPDSTCVGADGTIYQPMCGQGRVLILDENGTPFMNVLVQDRAGHLRSTNVCIKPGTNEGFITAGGSKGCGIYKFTAPGKGIKPYALQ